MCSLLHTGRMDFKVMLRAAIKSNRLGLHFFCCLPPSCSGYFRNTECNKGLGRAVYGAKEHLQKSLKGILLSCTGLVNFLLELGPALKGVCLICTKIKRFNGGLSLALFLGRIRGFQWILCHHCYTSRKYNSGDRCFCCLWKAMVPSLCLATLLTVVHRLHGFMYVMCCMCTN